MSLNLKEVREKLHTEETAESWPEIVDPFAEYVTPPFPMDAIPSALRAFAEEKSAQSGFDPGAYAFSLVVMAGNLVDHRARMSVGPFTAPAFMWGGLVTPSGGGKSVVMRDTAKPVTRINDELVKQSRRELAEWTAEGDKTAERPKWRQIIATDTTTEALGGLLSENPEGVNLVYDEITEFIGRMDAYSGNAGGKDRGVYLRAYDGGQVAINRASRLPLVVEDFSVGILAGMQPEKLAHLFKRSGSPSDGLYQRFLVYAMRPAGEVDYFANVDAFTEVNLDRVFTTLRDWTEAGTYSMASLEPAGKQLLNEYHNTVRRLEARTAAQRFAEHLGKFPGFAARMCFAMHCIECATTGEYGDVVKAETLSRALSIMRVLYRHSEAVYAVLDDTSGDVLRLVKSAAEAILAKQWDTFKRGDLTRNATYWQGADNREAEAAIDHLIELGWLRDVTPSPVPGKRGRRSDGVFLVNPAAHERFSDHATRVREARAERYEALKSAACTGAGN